MNRNVILYGAGSDMTKIVKMLEKQAVTPICIVDSNSQKWGGGVCDIPIVAPKKLEKYLEEYHLDTIIITAIFFDDIWKTVRNFRREYS